MKKQSFVFGAVILMFSNAISKILGAVFKIPLTYIIGEEGMAVYNTAFSIYIMFLSFITSGIPFAVSKLVSEYSSHKRPDKVRQTVKISNITLCAAGLLGSIVLYFGADFFALAMKEEKAVFAIKMIAPSIFFVAAGATVRSYFQGVSNMIPTAVSQITESVVKLLAGFLLAAYFVRFGISAASGGAVMGVTIGEAIATAVFLVIYIFSEKTSLKCDKESQNEILNSLFTIAVPLLFSSVVSSMLSVIDTSVIRMGLIKSGLDADSARRVYGSYTGYALTVFHLPIGILATFGVSILPIVAGSLAVGNRNKAASASFMSLKLTILLSLPCSVIIYFMSRELLYILFKNSASAVMLKMISPCIVMICISNILSAVLQSAGKIMTVFIYSTIGTALKITFSIILMPRFGIYGAIFGAIFGCFIVMVLNLVGIKRVIGIKFKITETLIKPSLSAVVMGFMIYLIKQPLLSLLPNVFLHTSVICVVSLLCYTAALLITGAADTASIWELFPRKKISL